MVQPPLRDFLVPIHWFPALKCWATFAASVRDALLLPEGTTVWVRGQSVNRPVRIYRKSGGPPYEIILTDMGRDSAAGYLLLPNSAQERAQAGAAEGQMAASRPASQR